MFMYYILTRVVAHDIPSTRLLLEAVDNPSILNLCLADETALAQSLVTQTIAARDQRMSAVTMEGYLLLHKFDSPHIHKQLVRYVSLCPIMLSQPSSEILYYLRLALYRRNRPKH